MGRLSNSSGCDNTTVGGILHATVRGDIKFSPNWLLSICPKRSSLLLFESGIRNICLLQQILRILS